MYEFSVVGCPRKKKDERGKTRLIRLAHSRRALHSPDLKGQTKAPDLEAQAASVRASVPGSCPWGLSSILSTMTGGV